MKRECKKVVVKQGGAMLIFGRRELSCYCREGKEEAKSGSRRGRGWNRSVSWMIWLRFVLWARHAGRREGRRLRRKEGKNKTDGRREGMVQEKPRNANLKRYPATLIL
jgi:hypothetical protein